MKRNLLLFFLSLAFLMPVKLLADTMYAVQSNDTLTFHYTTGPISMHMGNDDGTRLYIIDDEYVMEYGNVHLPEWREAGIAHVVFSSSFADARPTSTAYWFYKCDKLVSVDSIMNLNTEAVTNMKAMFELCSSLTTLDLSGLNTENVVNMRAMFQYCNNLTSVNVSDFNTSKVRDMSFMFAFGNKLTSFDLSCFDTSLVEDMTAMFQDCNQLKKIDLSGFDTKNVKSMNSMFNGCSSLDSLYLGSFELTSLTASKSMFYDCEKLKTIVVSDKWIFDPYITCQYMFTGCNSLIGGQGTSYQSLSIMHDDGFYAHIDGGPSNPGLLTADTMGQLDDNTGETRAYCVLKDGILTFYYDNKVNSRQGKKFPVEKTYDSKVFPKWCFVRREIKKVVFDNSFSAFHPTSTARWFYDSANLTEVSGTNNLNTSQVTSMSEMFRFNSSLKSIDLSSWDTSQVTDMGCLFCLCTSLSDINISNFDTSKVKGMYHMFHACPLTTLDLRSFDTSNVTDMVWMFIDSSVETIYVSDKWNTDKVESSIMMFDGCTRLVGGKGTKYDRKHIDHEYACIDGGMCAPGYLTGDSESAAAEPYAVLDDEGTLTFYYDDNKNCREGKVYIIEEEYTDYYKVGWFGDRENIQTAIFDKTFSNYLPSSTAFWFSWIGGLKEIKNLSNLNLSNVIDLSSFNTINVRNMEKMFDQCVNLTTIDLSHLDTRNLEIMHGLFSECRKLENIVFGSLNTSKVKDMSNMFYSCESIKQLDLGCFETEKVTSFSHMFDYCTRLENLYISNFRTYNAKTMEGMFSNCQSLKSIDVSSFNTTNVTNLKGMFKHCRHIEVLDISNFNTKNVTNMEDMFNSAYSLKKVYVSGLWTTSNTIDGSNMFIGCSEIVGGLGTTFDAAHTDYTFARIDGGPDAPGYFTYKEYVIPTSINAMPEESGKAQDEVWYNLQGVRIDNPAKGIYILNGKKVVRK